MTVCAITSIVGLGIFIACLIDEKPFWAAIGFIAFISCGVGLMVQL